MSHESIEQTGNNCMNHAGANERSAHWVWFYIPILTLFTPSWVLARSGETQKAEHSMVCRGVAPAVSASEHGYAEFVAVPTTADGTLFYTPSPVGDLLFDTPMTIERHRCFLMDYRAIVEEGNASCKMPSEMRMKLQQMLHRNLYPEIVDAYGGEQELIERSFPTTIEWLRAAGLTEKGLKILNDAGVTSRYRLGCLGDRETLIAMGLQNKDCDILMPFVEQAHQILTSRCLNVNDAHANLLYQVLTDSCIQGIY